jgi:hypothetical protein
LRNETSGWHFRKHVPTVEPDNYGFSDDYVGLRGPWALDESHSRALVSSYLAYTIDLAKVPTIPPPVLESEGAKYILGQLKVRQYPHSDAGPVLAEIAEAFSKGGERWKIFGFGIEPTPILLDGYLQEGEKHGGYPHHEEQRNEGGQGMLLYSHRIWEMPSVEDPQAKHTRVVELQIWHIEPNQTRFLVLEETFNDGYLGVDNFPGYERRWVALQSISVDSPA